MIAEIGHFAMILSLGLALLLSVLPLYGAARNNTLLMNSARPLSWGMFIFLAISFFILCYAFYTNDFTVQYVASNSNSQLPWYYRITAVWGAHEGSLLLWVLIQAGWTVAVAVFSRGMPQESVARVLAIMGLITVGFLLFIIVTSNPFLRTLPFFPVDGRDLNPLLQDPGLIIHPTNALHGLCRLLGSVLFCNCLSNERSLGYGMGALVSPLDNRGLVIPNSRYRTRFMVGLLRTRLGRLVVLGSSRKRIIHALAGRYCFNALFSGDRKARYI